MKTIETGEQTQQNEAAIFKTPDFNLKLFFSLPIKDEKDMDKKFPLGFLKLSTSLTLSQLREEIKRELDVPSQILDINSSAHWDNLLFSFIMNGFPLSLKQEGEISIAKDVGTVEINFKALPKASQPTNSFQRPLPMPPMPPMPHMNMKRSMPFGNLMDDDEDEEDDANGVVVHKEKKNKNEGEEEKNKFFGIITEDIISYKGDLIGKVKYIVFKNDPNSSLQIERESSELCNLLRKVTNNQVFYEAHAKIKQDSLLLHLPKIINMSIQTQRNKYLFEQLTKYLQSEYEQQLKAIESMRKEGKISFSTLWHIFQKDTKFQARMDEDIVGSIVVDSKYCSCFLGDSFSVTGSFVTSNGNHFSFIDKTFQIAEFEGLKDICDLPIQPLSQNNYESLTQRGEIFRSYAIGAHYLQYTGNLRQTNMFFTLKFKADGRVMIDPQSFQRFNPNSNRFNHRHMDDQNKSVETLPDDKLFMTLPTLQGFSFYAKKWGDIRVANLKPVCFDDQAFSRLVLNQETKHLVRSLVTNSGGSFTDIISGKGGGVIFLLHGSPGVGKTLTAEAVSELLHRPLYSVNIGELGVTPDQLENKLSQILEMSCTWNATVLLDEADIFLEQRTNSDIERNALVGIFLRLLEYHQGVLFLTTNRVQTFDDAFHSRISIALHYQPLDKPARKQIWKNLLEAAKVDSKPLDLEILSDIDLNGRQIKNTIRLAQTLAKEEGREVSSEDVNRCISVTKQFISDLKK